MGWVRWLKALADRLPDDDAPASPRPAAGRRKAGGQRGKGGEAYAREWTKVLEDTSPEGRDPQGTYTWELQADDSPGVPRPAPPPRKAQRGPPTNAYDSFTWEPTEGENPEDPWGLNAKKTEAEPKRPVGTDGVNPYDTGVFNASWTGRFDQR